MSHFRKLAQKMAGFPAFPLFAPGCPPDGVCQPDRPDVNNILIALALDKLEAPLK
jgi:hypothetical protein